MEGLRMESSISNESKDLLPKSLCEELFVQALPPKNARWADVLPSDDEDDDEALPPKSARWADVLPSDDEDDDEVAEQFERAETTTTVGPTAENSSRSGVSTPRGSRCDSTTSSLAPPPQAAQVDANMDELQSSRILNPLAPEFIPTMSSACPVAGVCCFVSKECYEQIQEGNMEPFNAEMGQMVVGGFLHVSSFGATPVAETVMATAAAAARRDADASGDGFANGEAAAPLPNELSWPSSGSTFDVAAAPCLMTQDVVDPADASLLSNAHRRRRRGRKSRPAPLWGMEASSARGGRNGYHNDELRHETLLPTPEEPSVSSAGVVATVAAVAEQEVVTEEQWQHRIAMRRKAVGLGKATREYMWYSEQKREDGEPMTPDPTDRSVSKRQWKYRLMMWRTAVNQRYLEEAHGSTLSTEEWQSTTASLIATSDKASEKASEKGDDADSSSL